MSILRFELFRVIGNLQIHCLVVILFIKIEMLDKERRIFVSSARN